MSVLQKIFRRKTTDYVSPLDKFSEEWDATHPKTKTQQQEIKKYQRIYYLRDNPAPEEIEGSP